jgi:xylulokinase
MSTPLYLGLDSSTQGLKLSLISVPEAGGNTTVVHSLAVNYDQQLPQYNTVGGMHTNGAEVHSPVLMWLEALDLLFAQLHHDQEHATSTSGTPFEIANIVAVSGSGQQHGSVYWKRNASAQLSTLDPNTPLHQQLNASFATLSSPIWADSSTSQQCADLEQAMGSSEALAAATGSRAYERFTGLQISKIHQHHKEAVYDQCERISLVSSFMCSILLGQYAPIDTADGSGTNLNRLLEQGGTTWCQRAVEHCGGSELVSKLGGAMVPAHTCLGSIAPYFVAKYGFASSCKIIAWSGDNPNSLAGLGLQEPGDLAVSLGTSDTMFTMMNSATPGKDGHVLRNPIDPTSFMGMLCFKNGSLAREEMAKNLCQGDWKTFGEMLKQTPPGNDGHVGLFYVSPEITPTTGGQSGVQRYGPDGGRVEVPFNNPAHEVRAVVEGKFLAMRHYGERIGMDVSTCKKIIATGGASNNAAMLQVMSDVFGCNVYTIEQSDSASLGAAFRALHGDRCDQAQVFVPFTEVVPSDAFGYTLMCTPTEGTSEVYGALMPRFAQHQADFAQSLRTN